jgi:multicomponent Na+:H+ antiporter subunit F
MQRSGGVGVIFSGTALAILMTMGMAMIRAFKGPTVFDRVLAVNMIGTKTVLLICLLGYIAGRPDFMDLALVYALLNFLGTIAILKYYSLGDLGATDPVEDRLEEED